MTLEFWSTPRRVPFLTRRASRWSRPQASHRRRCPLVLDVLEDRTVPSGFAVPTNHFLTPPNLGPAATTPANPSVSDPTSSSTPAARLSITVSNNTGFSITISIFQTVQTPITTPTTPTVSTPTTPTVSVNFTVDSSVVNFLLSVNVPGQTANTSSSSSSSSASSSSTNLTNPASVTTTTRPSVVIESVPTFFAEALAQTINQAQVVVGNAAQQALRATVTASPLQTGPTPSTIGSPGRGGFGQEEVLPVAIPDSPLNSFDMGIDDALRGEDLSRANDILGGGALDQLFREWPLAVQAQPQAESSPVEVQTPAVQPPIRDEVQPAVVPQPAQQLFDDGPLTQSSATTETSADPGAALRGGSTPLRVEQSQNSDAAGSAISSEQLSAGLAVLALAYPVGRERRAKQQRRPSL